MEETTGHDADAPGEVGTVSCSDGRPTMVLGSSAFLSVAVMPLALQTADVSALAAAVGFFFTVGAATAWRNGGCGVRDLIALAVAAVSASIAASLFGSGHGMEIPRGIYLLGGVLVAGAAEYLTWRLPDDRSRAT